MSHPRPFYYLENFCTALTWLRQRYGDLLNETERGFIERFQRLPLEASALLVRMIGRRGDLFRTAKLRYQEIGCARAAAAPLIELGWVDSQPLLTVAELGRLLRKFEVRRAFSATRPTLPWVARKAELLATIEAELRARIGSEPLTSLEGQPLTSLERRPVTSLQREPLPPRRLAEWWPDAPDVVYRVLVKPLCDQLRLLFFGNFRQDWSEFVLTDLGIFKYEPVARDVASRAFQTRQHIDTFHALFVCRQQLEESDDLGAVLNLLPAPVADNDWLEERRRKLQFQIAQRYEQQGDLPRALAIYRECLYAGSRLRTVRMLERLQHMRPALELATLVRERPADEVEAQQVSRMWPRLQRKAGLRSEPARPSPGWRTFQLVLPVAERPEHLEGATAGVLSQSVAPVYCVENGLLNSMFGLLFWQAIFAPVAGAFFHEFQAAPADLHAPEFRRRRAALFTQCFEQLESDAYRDTMWRNFHNKRGIQSPFVFWGLLSEELLSVALNCLPREHLKVCFARILADIRANRSGLPDLVQFWPEERRYQLIEVKGPGDRLQDNQIRWLTFCVSHGIPVSVCHVSWCTR
jgi:VRR-NUC domain